MPHMMPPLSPPQANNIGGHMTCFLYIPKASVGAVIGSKGSYINFVKQESRASCQVQERTDDPEANDRPVKITGYPECVWKVCILLKCHINGLFVDIACQSIG